MSNLSSIQSAIFGPELSGIIEAHAKPGCIPNLQTCLTSLTTIDAEVSEYCGQIQALATAINAVLSRGSSVADLAALRHLAELTMDRAILCREAVTSAIEEAGLQSVEEVAA